MLCFCLSVRLRKRVGSAAAEKSGGCFLRYGVSGFSLTSKWCPLGIACQPNQPWLIIRGIPRPPLSRNKRPHAEKCRHQVSSHHFPIDLNFLFILRIQRIKEPFLEPIIKQPFIERHIPDLPLRLIQPIAVNEFFCSLGF